MKKFLFLLMIASASSAFSQPIRLHLATGMANYDGDLREKSFSFNGANVAISAGATYDFSSHLSIRGEYSFGKVGADDKDNKSAALVQRNLNFKSYIRELSLVGEFNLYDIEERNWTPYFFAGVGVFRFSPYTYAPEGYIVHLEALDTEGQGMPQYPDRKPYKLTQMNIPFGAGVKYALSNDINIGFELGFRRLFTDYLDDVSTTIVDKNDLMNARGPLAVKMAHRGDELKNNPVAYPQAGAKRGSDKYNDSYYFAQVKISWRLPWFENAYGSRSNFYNPKRKSYGCPATRF